MRVCETDADSEVEPVADLGSDCDTDGGFDDVILRVEMDGEERGRVGTLS